METLGIIKIILEEGAKYAILAMGVYLTYSILDFPDLSVDGTMPLGAVLSAVLILHGWNPWLSLVVAFAAGAAAAVILRGPSIQDLRYYDQGQYVNTQRVEWTVSSVVPVRSVILKGKPWKVVDDNGVYSVEIPENGECVIRVTDTAGLSCEKSIHIANIDSEAPVYGGAEENGNMMILNFTDPLSGINWERTEFTKESGEKAVIEAVDREKGEILLKKEDFPLQAKVEDLAGNYGVYHMDLRTVKRPAAVQEGERDAQ